MCCVQPTFFGLAGGAVRGREERGFCGDPPDTFLLAASFSSLFRDLAG